MGHTALNRFLPNSWDIWAKGAIYKKTIWLMPTRKKNSIISSFLSMCSNTHWHVRDSNDCTPGLREVCCAGLHAFWFCVLFQPFSFMSSAYSCPHSSFLPSPYDISLSQLFVPDYSLLTISRPTRMQIASRELKAWIAHLCQEIKLLAVACSYQEKQPQEKDRYFNPGLKIGFIWRIWLPSFIIFI